MPRASRNITIRDDVWKDILQRVYGLKDASVKVGVLSEKGGDAPHDPDDGFTMVELAAVHEFGSPAAGIPERSFLRRTFKLKQDALARVISNLVKKVVTDKLDPIKALNMFGAWAAAEVKKTITEGEPIPPPNAPSTIARKGSERTLVDTGRMLNSITWFVNTTKGATE